MKPSTILLALGVLAGGYLLLRSDDDKDPIPQTGKWTTLNASGIPIRFESTNRGLVQVDASARVAISLPSGWRGVSISAVQVDYQGEGSSDIQAAVAPDHATGQIVVRVLTDKGAPAGELKVEFVQGGGMA